MLYILKLFITHYSHTIVRFISDIIT